MCLAQDYNLDQVRAVRTGLSVIRNQQLTPKICLIHGPPGTGKSKTIVGLLQKLFSEVRRLPCFWTLCFVVQPWAKVIRHKETFSKMNFSFALVFFSVSFSFLLNNLGLKALWNSNLHIIRCVPLILITISREYRAWLLQWTGNLNPAAWGSSCVPRPTPPSTTWWRRLSWSSRRSARTSRVRYLNYGNPHELVNCE